MKIIVELNDSLLEEIKRHAAAASHHLAGGAGARAAPLSETVDHDHDAFPHAARDVLGERPASQDSEGNWNQNHPAFTRGKADNYGRYQFGRKIFDAARQKCLAHLHYADGHRETSCHDDSIGLGLWANWLQEAGKDWQRARAYPQGDATKNRDR